MRNVSFNLPLVRVILTVAFVAICSLPLFANAPSQSETESSLEFPEPPVDAASIKPAPVETANKNVPESVVLQASVKLVTEASEQNKDQAITEIVELIEDNHFPRALEMRVHNRSYWIGNAYIDPLVMIEQPVFWIFVLAVLAMCSPKAYRDSGAYAHPSKLQNLAAKAKNIICSKIKRLLEFVPLKLELATRRPLVLPFLTYACSFCFLLGVGCKMNTPELWAFGFGFGSILVFIRAGQTIGVLGRRVLRYLFGTLLLVSGAYTLGVTLMIMPNWSQIDPLVIVLSLAISTATVIASLLLVRFRFSIITRIASINSVSALGAVLVLVSSAFGFFYGDNKIITYVDPSQELHTFW